jgi:hypothetical protein
MHASRLAKLVTTYMHLKPTSLLASSPFLVSFLFLLRDIVYMIHINIYSSYDTKSHQTAMKPPLSNPKVTKVIY